MDQQSKVKGWVPRCPNHGEPLITAFPLQEKGSAPCPVSMCMFEYTASTSDDAMVKDKNGVLQKAKAWDIVGSEK